MVTKNLFQTMNKISMNPIMNAPMSKGRVYEQSLEKYFELTEQEDLQPALPLPSLLPLQGQSSQSGFDHPRGIHLADLCGHRQCRAGGRCHHSRVPS